MDNRFRTAVKWFTLKFLLKEEMENLFAKICFFKAHPLVNEILLDYATNMAILKREDFSNDIINPIEVNIILEQNTINNVFSLTQKYMIQTVPIGVKRMEMIIRLHQTMLMKQD